MINANTFERAYKDTLSGFSTWEQKVHAEDWVLKPENIGPRVGIDETSFCHELYTIVHNKDAHGKRDSIKHYEDEILNYFDKRETNASAESLNSKMKCFRSSLRGVRDIPYFFYRSMMVFG